MERTALKDIIDNRRRLAFAQKLGIAGTALRENGAVWLGMLAFYLAFSRAADSFHRMMESRRQRRGLPGLNSLALNRQIWDSWNWSAGGEEWTPNLDWKESLVSAVLVPNVPEGARVLEIGPGGGRWTEYLLPRSSRLVGVDIAAACIEECRAKFGTDPRAEFHQTSGADLACIPDTSIDVIWSFDVFVHINAAEVAVYLAEFARVLAPGGRAIVHHGTEAGRNGGWRSNLTDARMSELISEAGLERVATLERWQGGEAVHALSYGDLISVIERPS